MESRKDFESGIKSGRVKRPRWEPRDHSKANSTGGAETKSANSYFRQVYRRRLSKTQRRFRRVRNILLTAGLIFFVLSPFAFHPQWSFGLTMRHIISAPNCSLARLASLDRASVGDPGYYNHHDADGDGIACEPMPRGTYSP